MLLTACMGIDVSSVRRAGSGGPGAGEAVAQGTIRFIVDGRPIEYGLLNKPALQLFHRGRGQLLSTPETARDGSFRWTLPAGDYGVAVVHGGMVPPQQPHRLPGGGLVFVNGLVDPGLEFSLVPGQVQELGTLVIEVESAAPKGVLFGSERVFGRLLAVRVEPAGAALRVIAKGSPKTGPCRPARSRTSSATQSPSRYSMVVTTRTTFARCCSS